MTSTDTAPPAADLTDPGLPAGEFDATVRTAIAALPLEALAQGAEFLSAYQTATKGFVTVVREEVERKLRAQATAGGLSQVKPELDPAVGTMSWTKPGEVPGIVNPDVFTSWVLDERPAEAVATITLEDATELAEARDRLNMTGEFSTSDDGCDPFQKVHHRFAVTVRPAFVEALKRRAQLVTRDPDDGGSVTEAVDTSTGQPIPGWGPVLSGGGLTIRPARDAKDRARREFARQALATAYPALPEAVTGIAVQETVADLGLTDTPPPASAREMAAVIAGRVDAGPLDGITVDVGPVIVEPCRCGAPKADHGGKTHAGGHKPTGCTRYAAA